MDRIVAMDHGVGDRLKQSLFTVLGQFFPRRGLVRRDPHIAQRESDRLRDLSVERSGYCLGIDLAGRSVLAPVTGCGDAGVRKPFLGSPAA